MIVGRILCLLGRHKLSDWVYSLPNKCSQRRVCRRSLCSYVLFGGIVHSYCKSEYESDNSCLKISICSHCGGKSTNIEHNYQETYSPSECCYKRECQRCKHAIYSNRSATLEEDERSKCMGCGAPGPSLCRGCSGNWFR